VYDKVGVCTEVEHKHTLPVVEILDDWLAVLAIHRLRSGVRVQGFGLRVQGFGLRDHWALGLGLGFGFRMRYLWALGFGLGIFGG